MYHIKSDKRSRSSALRFVRGLQECLQTMPLASITVSDLHRVTSLSRATFYRLFDTPEDILVYQMDQMTADAARVYAANSTLSTAQLLERTISLGLENHTFVRALMDNHRLDLLYRSTEEVFRQLDSGHVVFSGSMDPQEREYLISYLSMMLVATQIAWSRNGYQDTPDQLMKHMRTFVRTMGELLGDPEAEP